MQVKENLEAQVNSLYSVARNVDKGGTGNCLGTPSKKRFAPVEWNNIPLSKKEMQGWWDDKYGPYLAHSIAENTKACEAVIDRLISGKKMFWGRVNAHLARLLDPTRSAEENAFGIALLNEVDALKVPRCMHDETESTTFVWSIAPYLLKYVSLSEVMKWADVQGYELPMGCYGSPIVLSDKPGDETHQYNDLFAQIIAQKIKGN